MSLQTIINSAESISINRRKMIGIQYTRDEIVRASETTTRNPWRFTVKVSKLFTYAQARSLTESLDHQDRVTPQTITFGDNIKLNYLFAYQGKMNSTQLNTFRVHSFSGNQLVFDTLPAGIAGTVIFEPGDLIQITGYPYPFTIVNRVTLPGSGSTVTATTHRPNFIDDDVTGLGIQVGNGVNFNMLCTNMPTYTLVRGGKNAMVRFDTDFSLYEFTGTIL
jgi:hypothetical protein